MPRDTDEARYARAKADDGARDRSVERRKKQSKPSETGARSKRPAGAIGAGLYVVATPIGNAADVTLRALDVIAAADVVACEDTRLSGRLFAMHGVRAKLTPYHEHNAARVRPALIRRIAGGEAVALVADAGTPLVSDPGYRLVAETAAAGLPVIPVPGASAALAALIVSGLPTDRFLFAGFSPPRRPARRKALAELAAIRATLVLFESPRRLAAALADMADVFGARPAAVARELTKRFEEVRRGDLAGLARHYRQAGAPRGEVVVVIGPPQAAPADSGEIDNGAFDTQLRAALETQSVRDAAAAVAAATGLPRRRLYARALELEGLR